MQLLSCCDRDRKSIKQDSPIVQKLRLMNFNHIDHMAVGGVLLDPTKNHTCGVQVCLKYFVYIVSTKSYYILMQQIKLSPNVFETCGPCTGFHSSWSNFLPPFQPTCSLHGVFHCPSCAGRQLPLKGRCPWESSWRIASNICRSSFQPRWDRKSQKITKHTY